MVDFYDLGEDSLEVAIVEDRTYGLIYDEGLEIDFLDRSGASDFGQDGLVVNLSESVLSVEITQLGGGGGYNYLTDISPDDGTDVGQDTEVTISGYTMRNSGVEGSAPAVTVDGEEATVSETSNDNIYSFSHTVSLDGGENEITIVSDNKSLEVTKTLTIYRDEVIDDTPPTTTHDISGTLTDGWYTTTPEVTLSATDDETGVDSTFYRIDGGSWHTYDSPVSVTDQGNVTFEYYSVDKGGNEEDVNSTSWQTDTEGPTTSMDITGSHYEGDWYNSEVSVSLHASDAQNDVAHTYMAVDGGSFEKDKTEHTFTEDGEHQVEYYSEDSLGNEESVQTKNINIDTTPVEILDATISPSDTWHSGDGEITYTLDCGEDTSGWTGEIDLSAFGRNSSASLTSSDETMYVSFTPDRQDAQDSPTAQVWDKGGNTDSITCPQLTTHEYRTDPEDLYFDPYEDTSEPLADGQTFNDDSKVMAEWGEDYSREGELINGEGFVVVDSNKIQLTDKWQDDVDSNALGNMYVTVWED